MFSKMLHIVLCFTLSLIRLQGCRDERFCLKIRDCDRNITGMFQALEISLEFKGFL